MEDSAILLHCQELIVEILSWLPVKSLIRFRCVSKTWNSLIFDSVFVKLHLQRSSRNNTRVLITFQEYIMNHNGSESPVRTSVASCSISRLFENPSSAIYDICLQIDYKYQVVGVFNGLVCLEDGYIRDSFKDYYVFFCNPATRVMSKNSPLLGGYPVMCGFGYDDQSHTYKVVAILFDCNKCNWELRVYSLGDISWRNILTCLPFRVLEQNYGQFVSGTLNWLARLDRQLVIFSYDIKSETSRFLDMGDGIATMSRDVPYLGVLKGCLCLSQIQRRSNFVLWLMRDFGVKSSWTQLLSIRYWDQVLDYSFRPVIPLCMSKNDDLVLLADFEQFVLVDLKTKRIHLSRRTQDFNGGLPFFCHEYVPSLIMPYQN